MYSIRCICYILLFDVLLYEMYVMYVLLYSSSSYLYHEQLTQSLNRVTNDSPEKVRRSRPCYP